MVGVTGFEPPTATHYVRRLRENPDGFFLTLRCSYSFRKEVPVRR